MACRNAVSFSPSCVSSVKKTINGPVLFCSLAYVVVGVCKRLTLHGQPAGGFTHAGQVMTACRLQSNYSSMVTLHGGPVRLRPVRTMPCWSCRKLIFPTLVCIGLTTLQHSSIRDVSTEGGGRVESMWTKSTEWLPCMCRATREPESRWFRSEAANHRLRQEHMEDDQRPGTLPTWHRRWRFCQRQWHWQHRLRNRVQPWRR